MGCWLTIHLSYWYIHRNFDNLGLFTSVEMLPLQLLNSLSVVVNLLTVFMRQMRILRGVTAPSCSDIGIQELSGWLLRFSLYASRRQIDLLVDNQVAIIHLLVDDQAAIVINNTEHFIFAFPWQLIPSLNNLARMLVLLCQMSSSL